MYQKPTITKIGSYRTLTNGAGNGCLQRAVAVILRGIKINFSSDFSFPSSSIYSSCMARN